MKKFLLLVVSLVAFSPLFGQAQAAAVQNQPQEVIIKVQNQQVPSALSSEKSVTEKANEWVEFGKNVGTAMDAGLTSLTDHADKFSKTNAGKFTMAVIAWKVAGKDGLYLLDRLTSIAFGIPAFIVWTSFYIWFFRRRFISYRSLVSIEGPFWARKKTYKVVNEDVDWSGDAGVTALLSTIIWAIGSLVITFGVIF